MASLLQIFNRPFSTYCYISVPEQKPWMCVLYLLFQESQSHACVYVSQLCPSQHHLRKASINKQAWIKNFGKGSHMYKDVEGSHCWFVFSFFLNIPLKCNNLVSLRPNYYIFVGYLKTRSRRGFKRTPWTSQGTPLIYNTKHLYMLQILGSCHMAFILTWTVSRIFFLQWTENLFLYVGWK